MRISVYPTNHMTIKANMAREEEMLPFELKQRSKIGNLRMFYSCMVCVRIPICLDTVLVFKHVTRIPHFANRPSCIKVSVLLWEFLQGLNSAVHYLHGSCGRDKIFVAVRVLVVIVALVQVTPEDIYSYSKLLTK